MSFNFWQTHAMGWRERQQTTQNSVCSKYFSRSGKVVMTLDLKNGRKIITSGYYKNLPLSFRGYS